MKEDEKEDRGRGIARLMLRGSSELKVEVERELILLQISIYHSRSSQKHSDRCRCLLCNLPYLVSAIISLVVR